MPYILALDQGTTSSRAIIFDHDAAIVAVGQREFQQIFPRPGWVEHDPGEIWATQISVVTEALGRAHLRPRDVAAIGITNQRETTQCARSVFYWSHLRCITSRSDLPSSDLQR